MLRFAGNLADLNVSRLPSQVTPFCVLFFRVPEIELKNAKGLSNESVNLLKSHLEELAKKQCGEVRLAKLELWE